MSDCEDENRVAKIDKADAVVADAEAELRRLDIL